MSTCRKAGTGRAAFLDSVDRELPPSIAARRRAPIPENALLNALVPLLPLADDDGGFHPPTLADFFPDPVLFADTPFELNRIMIIRLLVTAALVLLFWLGTRRMSVVPSRGQVAMEFALGFVRQNIVIDTLGEKDGKRFMPLIMAIFFFVLGLNLTGVIPFLNIAGSSVIGVPAVLAIVSYIVFIYAGVRRHGFGYFKNSLFPGGVPIFVLPIVAIMEFISTFILRPVTLALRLLMNMVAGHMLLVLCFSATHFFFLTLLLAEGNPLGFLGIGTLAFGVIFTVFEIMVAVLQAYVFAFLATVYIQLSLAEEH